MYHIIIAFDQFNVSLQNKWIFLFDPASFNGSD